MNEEKKNERERGGGGGVGPSTEKTLILRKSRFAPRFFETPARSFDRDFCIKKEKTDVPTATTATAR